MGFLDKYNCILCKYNKYNKGDDSCWKYREQDENGYPIDNCNSLSNIYYGKIIKVFPFKQLHNLRFEINSKKEDRYYQKMTEKYGNPALEDDDFKFIWGIKSWDDLSGSDTNLFTMNDIDIIYDKNSKQYMLGVETAYVFKDYEDECKYLQDCLNAFTKYMDDNGLNKEEKPMLFMSCPAIEITADSIEDLYMNFKMFVNGFCSLAVKEENNK